MPKDYFQMIPTMNYDIDGDGNTKVAISILKRIKARTETLLDGAVFYNYQMQEGDSAEIIADKYYGSSKYHWVVLMMNNILDHTYDLSLNDANFEKYLKAEYGSFERAGGVTKTLSSSDYMAAYIIPQWFSREQHGSSGLGANSQLQGSFTSGTIPSGNSTAIIIYGAIADGDPFSNIGVGDTIYTFVPEDWYNSDDKTSASNYPKLTYTSPSTVISKAIFKTASYVGVSPPVWTADTQNVNRNYALYTNMNSNTYPEFDWVIGEETIQIKTGIHHFEMSANNSVGTRIFEDSIHISHEAYVNSSIGTFDTKKIVSNWDYEDTFNEEKRNIYLLKKEYLPEFVSEFEALMKIGL